MLQASNTHKEDEHEENSYRRCSFSLRHDVVRSFMSLRECEVHRAKYEGSDSYCAPWKDTSAWALWAVVRSGSSSF